VTSSKKYGLARPAHPYPRNGHLRPESPHGPPRNQPRLISADTIQSMHTCAASEIDQKSRMSLFYSPRVQRGSSQTARCASTETTFNGPARSCPSPPPSIGSGHAVVHCAHGTSTFLSCAFCEQEGRLATPYL
jgi:hypothetical protein